MSSTEIVNHVASLILLTVAALTVGYMIRYSRSNWKLTLAGKSGMWQSAGLVFLIIVSLLTSYLGRDYVAREFVRFIGYGFVLGSVLYSRRVLARYQRFAKGEAPDPDPHLGKSPVPPKDSPPKG